MRALLIAFALVCSVPAWAASPLFRERKDCEAEKVLVLEEKAALLVHPLRDRTAGDADEILGRFLGERRVKGALRICQGALGGHACFERRLVAVFLKKGTELPLPSVCEGGAGWEFTSTKVLGCKSQDLKSNATLTLEFSERGVPSMTLRSEQPYVFRENVRIGRVSATSSRSIADSSVRDDKLGFWLSELVMRGIRGHQSPDQYEWFISPECLHFMDGIRERMNARSTPPCPDGVTAAQ